MSVIVETSLGDFTIDLFIDERPKCCKNFLKLCKIKYYNFCLFHSVQRNFIAQTGDPTRTGKEGESVNGVLYGEQARYFDWEFVPKIKHEKMGLVSMVNNGNNMHGSQFFISLADSLDYLDGVHTVFGEVTEGLDVIDKINEAYCDEKFRPFRDIRIHHTIILDDPYDDPPGLEVPDRSPDPTKEVIDRARLAADAEIDDFEGKTEEEIKEILEEREEKSNAQLLEMIGDLPSTDITAPENVLFVCKLNSVTTDEDLEIIFSRFGTIKSCEVIRDQKTGESLQYAFIEFEKKEDCESAYFKMDNVLIDDRRIHVDFSQSVSKVKWKGKGKGVETIKDEPKKPKYIIKDKSQRQDNNYDLVFEENGDSKKSKKTNREKSPDGRSHKIRQPYRSRSRSTERRSYRQDDRRSPPPLGRHDRHSSPPRYRGGRYSPPRDRGSRGYPGERERDSRKISPKRRAGSRDRGTRGYSREKERDSRKISPKRRAGSRDQGSRGYSPGRARDSRQKSPKRLESRERGSRGYSPDRVRGREYSDDRGRRSQRSRERKTYSPPPRRARDSHSSPKRQKRNDFNSDSENERNMKQRKKRDESSDSSSSRERKKMKKKRPSSSDLLPPKVLKSNKRRDESSDENINRRKKRKGSSSEDESDEKTNKPKGRDESSSEEDKKKRKKKKNKKTRDDIDENSSSKKKKKKKKKSYDSDSDEKVHKKKKQKQDNSSSEESEPVRDKSSKVKVKHGSKNRHNQSESDSSPDRKYNKYSSSSRRR